MHRRRFITALAGLPIAGWGAVRLGLPKSGIHVSGLGTHSVRGVIMPSLRFEHVPAATADEVVKRLEPIFWSANSCRLGWAPARTLKFVNHFVSHPKNGHCSVVCAFKASHPGTTWYKSHRPVDFETEILQALTGSP